MVEHSNIPVAVVGVGALFPQSPTARGFWHNILEGVDLIGDVPEGRWRVDDFYDADQSVPDKTYAKRGGFIEPTAFDAMKFGVPPNIIEATDTSQLLALIVAQQVLDDAANGQFEELDRDRISVVLGVTSGQELMNEMASRLQRPQWVKGLREAGLPEDEVQAACDRISEQYTPWQESTFPGLLGNVVAGRIANRFDLGGTNAVTDAACGSTLAAMTMGLNELYLGHSDIVIAGGVDTFNDIFMYMCFSKTPALSASGDCRPFSDAADGTMLGEGLAMFALKRLEDAERDGDEVYAVLTGMGSSSDGRAKSIYAPVSEGQAKALTRAYERSGYDPATVDLVEAHGTGTKAGDVAEFGGLRMIYGDSRDDKQWCALGSVKSQVGHTKAAAGAAGLFKIVMALHHKVLPPTIKVDRPNPKLDIDQSPFYLNTERRPWVRGSDHPRRAAVSAFGFGGSNFHLTAEEYLGDKPRPRFRHTESELVVLGAANGSEIAAACTTLASGLDDRALDQVARDTQLSFEGGAARLGIVTDSIEDLRRKLQQAGDAITTAPENNFALPNGIYYGTNDAGRTAFLFPGQGSQFVGMGADLAMTFDGARAVWDASADLEFGDEPLHRVVFPPPAFDDATREAQATKLRATQWAQPALGAASLASFALMRELGLEPDAVGGHSFGEVTALCAAGVIDQNTALQIARKRGELMAEAASSTSGTMTAVQAASSKVEELLAEWGSKAVVANYNGPRQTVLSGSVEAIDDVEQKLESAGLAFKRLNVATAFHSEIVADATKPFAEFLQDVDVNEPALAVWANSTAAAYESGADSIRKTLSGQIAAPVRFEQMIRAMLDDGVTTFVEVGPGTVLTRLVRRIAQDDDIATISTDARGRDGVTALWHALAQFVANGVQPNFAPIWNNVYVTEPTGPAPKLTVDIWGGNHNRPYPPADGQLPAPNPPRVATERPAKPAAPAPPARASEQAQSENTMKDDQNPSQSPSYPQSTAPAAPAAPVDAAWVHAFAESQRQMAHAHAAYQQAMAQTHTAFLQAVAASQANMTTMLGATPGVAAQLPQAQPVAFTPMPAPQPTAPAPAPVRATPQAAPPVTQPAPTPMPQAPAPSAPAPVATPAPQAAPQPQATAPAAPSRDLEALLLDVVADKTGYPAEMLELEMQLEADLGIDSIKRVEILSALQEAAPELPEMDGNAMGQLQTLGEIVTFLGEHTPTDATRQAETQPLPSARPEAPTTQTAANGSAGGDIRTVLLAAVSDKTGYPTEMLELDMKLEADLGIDSIKRVEILSAVNEALPELPEVDGSDMAGLGTLREILDFMNDAVGEKKNVRLSL